MSSFTYPGAFALLTSLALCGISSAQQPPLAEVARREAERRKALQPATRVLTNKDLPKTSTPVAPPVPVSAEPTEVAESAEAAAPAAPAGEKAAPEAAKNEAWWRARISVAREALRRNEVFAEALQSRINALSADFAARDDPFQRAKVAEDRQKALAELARVQEDMALSKQAIEGIEEEARKGGVAPGWLR